MLIFVTTPECKSCDHLKTIIIKDRGGQRSFCMS